MILLLVFAIHLKIQMFLMNISSNQILKLLILGKKRQNFQSVYKIWKVEIGNLFLTEIENICYEHLIQFVAFCPEILHLCFQLKTCSPPQGFSAIV